MATKNACVLHTPAKRAEAEEVGKQLRAQDYEVCITGVSTQTAKTVKTGDKAHFRTP
jgi:sorbitol-specific phosphotransferase system component IIA